MIFGQSSLGTEEGKLGKQASPLPLGVLELVEQTSTLCPWESEVEC